MDTARPTPDNLESLAVTLASAVERQVTAYVGHASEATRAELRSEFEAALQQHHESVSVAVQAIVPEVQRLLNELNTQVLQRIDTTENRVTDRMLQLEERINEQQGTKIANLEATIGRIGGGFDDAMQALSQRMLELENRLFATNDAIDAVRAKTESFDDSVFTEVREQLSSAVGEAMLVRIELDRLAGTTDEKLDRTNLRMAEIEALLSDEMDVSAAVQLERLEEIERALAELDPDMFVRHTDPTAGVRTHEVAAEAGFSPAPASAAPVGSFDPPHETPHQISHHTPSPAHTEPAPAFSVPTLTLPTLPSLPTHPSASF